MREILQIFVSPRGLARDPRVVATYLGVTKTEE